MRDSVQKVIEQFQKIAKQDTGMIIVINPKSSEYREFMELAGLKSLIPHTEEITVDKKSKQAIFYLHPSISLTSNLLEDIIDSKIPFKSMNISSSGKSFMISFTVTAEAYKLVSN